MITATSGQKCARLLRKSGQIGCLAKTLLESSAWHSTLCFLTWKVSVTPAKRLLFRLVPSAPRTGGIGSGLWPTIRASDSDHGGPNQRDSAGNYSLPGAVVHAGMWPTPNARDYKGQPGLAFSRQASLPRTAGGRLNVAWVCQLQALPTWWLDTESSPLRHMGRTSTSGKCRALRPRRWLTAGKSSRLWAMRSTGRWCAK